MASFDEAPPGNSATGKKIFRSDCSQCHGGIGISRSYKQGPNLNGLFGRQSGSTTPVECMYSVAIIDKAVNLEEKTLYDYLLKPREYIPETKMFFPSLKKPQECADLIAYLKD